MNIEQEILSQITTFLKYSKYDVDLKRRETWNEIVDRNKNMHLNKFPHLNEDIEKAYKYVYNKKVLPSMRALQFSGKPIDINNVRIYNCAYLPIDDHRCFSEIMFLLLSGTGVGYSVQNHHIDKLPEIKIPTKNKRYLIGDSIEGWADSIRMLLKAYLVGGSKPIFDARDVRPKGSRLITAGGKAPGPEPLLECLFQVEKILMRKQNGEKLTSVECHDIICYIADAVLSGGIRRAALISLFDMDDEYMLNCKSSNIKSNIINKEYVQYTDGSGLQIDHNTIKLTIEQNGIIYKDVIIRRDEGSDKFWDLEQYNENGTLGWWVCNPQRGRANNSAMILRHKIKKNEFLKLWKKVEDSFSGEPGIYFSNDKDTGTNPSLRAGTKVLTTDGIFNIENLQDKEFYVKNLNGNISKARCFLSGKNKQLYELTLKGGHKYYATPEHEWPVWNGKNYEKIKTPFLKSKDLLPIIKENQLFKGQIGTNEEGFVVGWCLGDGNLSVSNVGKKQIGFVFSKEDQELGISDKVINILNKIGETNIKGHTHKAGTLEIQTTNNKIISWIEGFGFKHKSEGLPNKIWDGGTEDFRKGFIDGLFSSDGYVSNLESSESRIIFNSSHENLINEVSELLGFYGIKNNISHKLIEGNFPNKKYNGKLYHNYSLKITDKESLKHFHNIFSLSHTRKQNNLINILENKIKTNKLNKYSDKIEIIDCKLVDIYEDVWDITVYDDTHCFQISHCITGNCGEISLRPYQFCNLCEVNVSDIESQDDLNERVKAAALIGTLQASYTNFHYLRDIWRKTTEKEALIGVGMTGIASGEILKYNLEEAVELVKLENEKWAKLIGINKAARTTTIKPSGTSSLVLGTSSGIHGWHDEYYIRTIRLGKNESLYYYLLINHPELVEDDKFKPEIQAIISVPQKAPHNAILRNESALELLERVKKFNIEWVKLGHRKGENTNNVSATISIKPEEWVEVGEWMWNNKEFYNGLSVLPFDGGTYVQAPFQSCSKEKFDEMIKHLHNIDLTQVVELEDNTSFTQEASCAGGKCEV